MPDERRAGLEQVVTNIAVISRLLEHQTDLIKDLHETIMGNSKPGLKTTLAVVKSSLARAWWFIAIIAMGIMGLGVKGLM